MTALERVQRAHRDVKTWPLVRNDPRIRSDGYVHRCNADGDPWPCDVIEALREVTETPTEPIGRNDR